MAGLPTPWRSPLLAGLLLLLAPSLLLLAGCGDDPAGPELSGDNLHELVSAGEDLQLIEDVVERLALDAALRAESELTFFAPTDEALLRLGPDMLALLNGEGNADVLRKLVRRHLVPGRYRTADLRDGEALTPLEGPPLSVRVDGETITVGGAAITEADHETGNGVLHEVDEVVRDHLTLAERLRVTPLIGAFAGALRTAGLGGLVEAGEPYTLLIPINSAFANLGAADLQALLSSPNRDVLLKVLRHHVLPGRVRAEQLDDGITLMPLDGTPLEVEPVGGLTYVGGARVVVPEIETSDGLIYLLDAVVLNHLNLTERLRVSPAHTIFYQILKDAGFLDLLREDGPFTLFAPTDATLATLGPQFVAELQRRPDLLLRTVQYQIVPGRLDQEHLLAGPMLTTLGGYSLPVSTLDDSGALSVILGNRGRVTFPPKETRNGLLYTIAPFLIPPGLDLEGRAVFAGVYRFLSAMERAGLTSLLSDEGPFTVFAPSNEALQSAGFLDAHTLRYHFVLGRYDATQLSTLANPFLPTLAEADLSVTFDPFNGLLIGGGAQPTSMNHMATNGVIHVIDGVLTPP